MQVKFLTFLFHFHNAPCDAQNTRLLAVMHIRKYEPLKEVKFTPRMTEGFQSKCVYQLFSEGRLTFK